jgi:hypothetical protein
MHNAIYQNHLGLEYLLASKEEVCNKFNLNNCCLQINDFLKGCKGGHTQNEKACSCPHPDLEKMGSQWIQNH